MTGKAEKAAVEAQAFDEAIATLSKMKDAAVIDDTLLDELAERLEKLSPEAQRRFMDLPIVQRIVEVAGASAQGQAEPGTERRIGSGDIPFSFKVPYGLADVYKKWPVLDSYMADADYTVVTPGGWVFKLHRDILYDIPQGEPCPEGHGYQLPNIVVGIINDSKLAIREKRRETEAKPFGLGVKFIETGWAGKAEVVNSEPGGGLVE